MATTKKSRTSSRPTAKGSATNATAVLTQDHRDVEALFVKFEGLGDRALKSRRSTVDKIVVALSQHASIEETVFYPAVRAMLPTANDDVLEALEEHHVVKWTLDELTSLDPTDERFTAKVTVLIENVRHHVKEEERDLFPKVRKALSRGDLDDLGARLLDAKRIAPTKPHPRAPDTPPGNLVAAVLTAPLDAASNAIQAAAERVRDAAR